MRTISTLAGKPPPASLLVNLPRLVTAYYAERPDPSIAAERVTFGTSGHRGSAFQRSFTPYVNDLASVVDMAAIASAGVRIGVDPLGGAGVHYWEPIIAKYGIAVTVVNDAVDPTFRFMTVDWDGQIRMDCSSPYAMAPLVAMRERFDVASPMTPTTIATGSSRRPRD